MKRDPNDRCLHVELNHYCEMKSIMTMIIVVVVVVVVVYYLHHNLDFQQSLS